MMAQYQVQYSDDDFFHVEGDYCKMHSTVIPPPQVGSFVVKPSGIYEIAQVTYSMDDYYDIYIQPVVTQTADGDVIVVTNKNVYYRCINKDGVYGFKKITMLTLLNQNHNLENRLDQLQAHVNELQKYINKLIN
jgi:hypothetical protein